MYVSKLKYNLINNVTGSIEHPLKLKPKGLSTIKL